MEKQRNPVAKNAKKFNKASVQRDRKKDQKRGYKVKHKDKHYASTTPPVEQEGRAPSMSDTEKHRNMTRSDKSKLSSVAKMMNREKNRKQNQAKRVAQRAIVKKHKFANKNPNEDVKEPTGDLKDACWKGYTAVGTKKKNGKTVPNCVPKEDSGKVSGIDGSKRVGTKIVPKYIPKKDAVITISADNSDVSELSNRTLSSYKTKAAKSASAADKAGNYKKADKRFSGITRATNKQFKNDAKKESAVDRDKTKSYIPPGVSAVKEELDKMKKRKHMNLKRRVKNGDRSAVTQLRKFEKDHAKDLEKKPRSAKQISKGEGSAQDSNLIVQLRKSQDSGGKHAIEVGGGKKVKLDKKTVDNLLKQYDKMKPDSKRKWQTVATKKLRSMAK